ncbi:hypothetical protein [Algoriphagus aestuariicola]
MKAKFSILLTALAFLGGIAIQTEAVGQTMTCRLIRGSEKTFENGMRCALYNCPNGEQVQSCIMP